MCDRMFAINEIEISSNIKMISKSIHDVTIGSTTDSILDSELADIPNQQLSNVLILDPDLFDSTGIGRQALYDIRETRKRFIVNQSIKEDFLVVPCQLKLLVYAAEFRNSHSTIQTNSIDKTRWSINWEPIKKRLSNQHKPLSSSVTIFEFHFDGAIEQLDQDIPLSGSCVFNLLMNQTGTFNAFILTVEFDNPNRFKTNNDLTKSTSLIHSYSILWMDSIDIALGQTILCEATHDGTRLRLRLAII